MTMSLHFSSIIIINFVKSDLNFMRFSYWPRTKLEFLSKSVFALSYRNRCLWKRKVSGTSVWVSLRLKIVLRRLIREHWIKTKNILIESYRNQNFMHYVLHIFSLSTVDFMAIVFRAFDYLSERILCWSVWI